MASIDERVVAMSFENAKFEAGVAQTMATLAKLDTTLANIGKTSGLANIETQASKVTLTAPMTALDKLKAKLGFSTAPEAFGELERASSKVQFEGPSNAIDKLRSKLSFPNAADAFNEVEKASDKVTLDGMTKNIDDVSSHFSGMQVAAIAAFSTIVSRATTAGLSVAKSFSFGPVIDGLHEYATNLNSIQTILANTEASGADLDDVNRALQDLNTYSDQTIYNFSQMAKNIGTFTAAGVDLDTATDAIKGIANLAAVSGSSSEQASNAMLQLSQAISAGRVSLQDWNSVVNAGMGGTVFQRALAQTAEQLGTIKKGAVELKGPMKNVTIAGQSFRESITAKPGEESWLTSQVLTDTLKQFTGDMSDAQLAAQGFNAEQIKSIQQTAKTAVHAATEVKTLSQVFDVAKETIGSGWASTFQTILGNFTESKTTFTELSNAINGFINASSKARNKVLGDWKALGGRQDLIEGIKATFAAIASVLEPIHDALRDIFPPETGKELAELTKQFREFAEGLQISPQTAKNLRDTFGGIFAVLHIGVTVLGDVIKLIGRLLGVVSEGSGGFLSFTAGIGNFLKAIDAALTKGGALEGFFQSFGDILTVPLKLLQAITQAIFGLFKGTDNKGANSFADSMSGVAEKLKPVSKVLDALEAGWQKLVDILADVQTAVQPLLDNIAEVFSNFADLIAHAIENTDFSTVFGALNTTLLAGILVAIKKALGGGIGVDIGGGLLKNVSETMESLTSNLRAMQKNIQADTLLKIAAAIGVLAAGVLLLSNIDPKKLNRAMTAVAVGLGELVGALALLGKVTSGASFLTLPLISASLVGLAVAVTILAAATKIFSTMSWDELAKGLSGVGGALVAVAAGTKLIGPQTLIAAAAIIPLAIGLNVLAVAVKQFSSLSWEEMGRGLLGVAGSLLAIGAALKVMPVSVILIGPGLIAVGLALNLLAGAVGAFGDMDLKTLGKGILGIAAALVAIGVAIAFIPPTVALQAAGLVILAAALTGIAGAVGIFGGMSVGKLVKGLIAMGGALVVLGLGLTAMEAALPGAAALLAAAAAFAILAPVLAFMGNLSWGTILKGLAAMAATLAVLAVAGGLAAIPLAILGAGLLTLGLGMAAVSASIYLLAKGLALLGTDGTKGVAVMVAALTGFMAILPTIIIKFLKGLVDIVAEIAKIAPRVLMAVGVMLDSIIAFVTEAAPKLAIAIGVLVQAILKVLVDNSPLIIAAGFKILSDLLTGFETNMPQVVDQVTDIIVLFLKTLSDNQQKLVDAGTATLMAFLLGISNQFPALVTTVVKLITKFVDAVGTQIGKITQAAANLMLKFLSTIASYEKTLLVGGAKVVLDFLDGIAQAAPKLISKGLDIAAKFLLGISKGLVGLAKTGADAVIDFMNGIAEAIRTKGPELRAAGYNVADALLDGIWQGIDELGHKIVEKLGAFVRLLPDKAKKLLGISSPSKVFKEIGEHIMEGMSAGIDAAGDETSATMSVVTRNLISQAKDGLSQLPDVLDGIMDLDPVITPVLDLSAVEKGAKKLGDLTNVVPITAAASYGQASVISAEKQTAETDQPAQAASGPTFSFEQNNYSPEALSEIEIYRQTNNQLAQVKRAVGLVS